ncbi:MAG: penicillin-binding protein 2 [Desulfobacteraceae bacterium]|nr:penicillin-binding protein 2 [Desulfobacteraceae bacterium]
MATYLDTVDSDWFRQRLTGVMLCVCAAFVALIVRLVYLQAIEGEEYRRLSASNSIRLQSVDAPRGLVYDRNGKMIVDNRPSFDLKIIVKDAKPLDRTIRRLSGILDVAPEVLMNRLSQKKYQVAYKPIVLLSDIGRDKLAAVEVYKYELPGISVGISPRRHYIDKQSAAHLLGYLGEINADELKLPQYANCNVGDYIGKFGVEKSLEKWLRGTQGGRQVEVNATGQVVRVLKTVDALPGHNLFLTIDRDLQKKAETLMADHTGAIVVMDPRTGEILAMVSNPSFDQNAFITGMSHGEWNTLISNPNRPLENKAIQAEYPPASTYKFITAIAGLEEKIVTPDTEIQCPGYYKFGNRTYRCWKKYGHGKVNIHKALAESCDVYFYLLGQELGIERLAWYAKNFGLGSPTRIQLDQEDTGIVPNAAWKRKRFGTPWQQGETLSTAIGQGFNLTTPIQMAVAISSIANDGIRVQPKIVKSVKAVNGDVIQENSVVPTGSIPASEETLKIIKQGLWEVVNSPRGTAFASRIEHIEISGKTGTAQVFSRKTSDDEESEDVPMHLRPHAWFVAYGPSREPRIAVTIIVEHGEHGSDVAPIATELIRVFLDKDIKPETGNVGQDQSDHSALIKSPLNN